MFRKMSEIFNSKKIQCDASELANSLTFDRFSSVLGNAKHLPTYD